MRLQTHQTRRLPPPVAPPVVWALDAFSKDFETHSRTVRAIHAHAPDSEIHPVYVLSEEVFSGRGYSSFLRAALKPRAHHNLLAVLEHELLKDLKGFCKTPRVLIEPSANASLCAGKLLRYAKRIGSELVAFGTHGRGALSRWFAGSFGETLIRESHLPLLIAGPRQVSEPKAPRVVIVPTDFDSNDRNAFEGLVELAAKRDLTLHLFHRSGLAFETWIEGGAALLGENWVSIDALLNVTDRGAAAEVKSWLALATDAGVEIRLASPTPHDSLSESILDYAQKLEGACPLIALLNGRACPARLARDLIRSSPYPLFVAGHA